MDILSVLTGGATGVLGTIVGGVADYAKKKQDHSHELKMGEQDLEMFKLEASHMGKVEALKAEAKIEEYASKRLTESIKADSSTYSGNAMDVLLRLIDKAGVMSYFAGFAAIMLVFVDFLRGVTRPLLTITLVGVSCFMAMGYSIPGELNSFSGTVDYMASTAVAWWFGSRQLSKLAVR